MDRAAASTPNELEPAPGQQNRSLVDLDRALAEEPYDGNIDARIEVGGDPMRSRPGDEVQIEIGRGAGPTYSLIVGPGDVLNHSPCETERGCRRPGFASSHGPLRDHGIFLRTPWPVLRARLNDPTRDNDWTRSSQPAQREWIQKAVREWPVRAAACGFEFINARWFPARVLRQLSETRAARASGSNSRSKRVG